MTQSPATGVVQAAESEGESVTFQSECRGFKAARLRSETDDPSCKDFGLPVFAATGLPRLQATG